MAAQRQPHRQSAINGARLYFVSDGNPPGATPIADVLRSALEGGVDVVQLRDKGLGDSRLIETAAIFRRLATQFGIPFILNDRPDLVAACGADGVHVGQEDAAVEIARELAGEHAIVGLSTHAPDQLRAACAAKGPARPDYLSVGPVWATPTKPGRPASGLVYVRHATQHASLPWFAIGGISSANIGEVLAAGAKRIVVVRALRDADDPGAAARELQAALERGPRAGRQPGGPAVEPGVPRSAAGTAAHEPGVSQSTAGAGADEPGVPRSTSGGAAGTARHVADGLRGGVAG